MRSSVLLLALLAACALAACSLPAAAQSCGPSTPCPRAGKECCPNTYGGGSSCVNLIRADDHCGACGYQCDPEQHDEDAGRRCCGKLVGGVPQRNCVDTQGDLSHCGGCDRACPTTPVAHGRRVCTKGVCGVSCDSGFVLDGDACVCPAGFVLAGDVCAPVCTGGPFSGCFDNPNCFCFPTTEGSQVCTANDYCVNLAPCASSADCPAGRFCQVNTGCGPAGVCDAPCTATTGPPVLPARASARGAGAAATNKI